MAFFLPWKAVREVFHTPPVVSSRFFPPLWMPFQRLFLTFCFLIRRLSVLVFGTSAKSCETLVLFISFLYVSQASNTTTTRPSATSRPTTRTCQPSTSTPSSTQPRRTGTRPQPGSPRPPPVLPGRKTSEINFDLITIRCCVMCAVCCEKANMRVMGYAYRCPKFFFRFGQAI